MKTIALVLVALCGTVSTGQVGYSYDAGIGLPGTLALQNVRNGQIADLAALDRNAHALAIGAQNGALRDAAALREAILSVIAGARAAAIRDQINLQRASATLDIINADGAARNAFAQAAINDYAAVRNAHIQSQQLAINRYIALREAPKEYTPIPLPPAYGPPLTNIGLGIPNGVGLGLGFSPVRANALGWGPATFGYGFDTGALTLGARAGPRRSSRRN